ncbi:MAG: hypothetical protein KJO39_06510 [Bacteroidia bacterium]|nr:hypothetical protein [Bacteroidia bacterium]NNE04043.1 hypothetical protein [Eudoraea sp.]NNM09483.1 hypothetical protein [Flavobacteriaceae bacterium]
MTNNFNEESHAKGKQFEDFVQNKLFPKSQYRIIHRTSDFEQNSVRFVTNTLKPDFKIKSLVNNKEFYIEAKYRSKTYNDVYDILSDKQLESFPEYAKEAPIYIAFGYGGEPNEPEFVSLIPYGSDISQSMSPEEILLFNVKDYPIAISQIHKIDNEPKANSLVTENSIIETEPKDEPTQKTTGKKKIWIGIGAIGVIVILFLLGSIYKNESEPINHEEMLKNKVMSYYEFANNYQYDSLTKYLGTRVNWYGAAYQKPSAIIEQAKELQKRIPYLQCIVNPESFTINKQQDGDYYVSYDMVYKRRKKFNQKDEVYNLKMITTWNDKFMLNSVSEIRK